MTARQRATSPRSCTIGAANCLPDDAVLGEVALGMCPARAAEHVALGHNTAAPAGHLKAELVAAAMIECECCIRRRRAAADSRCGGPNMRIGEADCEAERIDRLADRWRMRSKVHRSEPLMPKKPTSASSAVVHRAARGRHWTVGHAHRLAQVERARRERLNRGFAAALTIPPVTMSRRGEPDSARNAAAARSHGRASGGIFGHRRQIRIG